MPGIRSVVKSFRDFHSFVLQNVMTQMDGGDFRTVINNIVGQFQRCFDYQVRWIDTEDALVLPYKLEGVLFSGLSINQCMLHFGPVITNLIRNF